MWINTWKGTFGGGGLLVLVLATRGRQNGKIAKDMPKNALGYFFYGEYSNLLRIIPSLMLTFYIWNVNGTFSMVNWHILKFLVAMETIPYFLNGLFWSQSLENSISNSKLKTDFENSSQNQIYIKYSHLFRSFLGNLIFS